MSLLMVAMSVEARSLGDVALKLKRQDGVVQVAVLGLGANARVVTQTSTRSTWRGRLIGDVGAALKEGPQQVSMPEAGLASIRLDASNNGFELRIEATSGRSLPKPSISSNGKDLVLNFRGLSTASQQARQTRLNLRRPGRVQQSAYVPPLRARAVAPPVGDLAVGSMLVSNRSYVNVSGPEVSLTLNNAPAKDALMSLARLGNYGFVFVGGESRNLDSQTSQSKIDNAVTMSFRGEPFGRALNSVLMASGLQAKLDGRTLLVGTSISAKSFGPQMSKVFRMNQVDVASASQYLGNLGAVIKTTATVTSTARETESSGTTSDSSESSISTKSETSKVETYSSGTGPLLGLIGTTDARLNTITLVGEPKLISVAENYLKQIDLRKRQVAVKVQILNVDLSNDKSIDASFSARIGNTFIVSESGKAFMNFGDRRPGSSDGTGLLANGSQYSRPGSYSAGTPSVVAQKSIQPSFAAQDALSPYSAAQDALSPYSAAQDALPSSFEAQTVKPPFVPQLEEAYVATDEDGRKTSTVIEVPYINPVTKQKQYVPDTNPNSPDQLVPQLDVNGQPIYVPSTDPSAQPTFVARLDANGQPIYVPSTDPSAQPTFVARVDANGQPIYVPSTDPSAQPQLVNRVDSKGRPILVPGKDPTQYDHPENSIFGYLEAVIVSTSAKTLAQPTLLVQEGESAMVQTGTNVITSVSTTEAANGSSQFTYERQNAGLTLEVNVEKIDDNGFVTLDLSPEVNVPVPAGTNQGVAIFNLSGRKLSSGQIRLRDRQTLVLTGVIQDQDKEIVRKWPVLGDLPILGQMFRSSANQRTKSELVILVTPSIIDDNAGGSYGYGYRPSTREARQFMGSNRI